MDKRNSLNTSERERLDQARALIKAGRFQSPLTCPACRRELSAALLECPQRARGQCPYRVEKRATGSITALIVGLVWLVVTIVGIVGLLSDEGFGTPDLNTWLVFGLMLIPPIAVTLYGALVYLNNHQLAVTSQQHGEWLQIKTVFGSHSEIRHPVMIVQAPHWQPTTTLPMSVLAKRLCSTDGMLRREPAFSRAYDAAVVYLTLVGLMMRRVVELYAQPTTQGNGRTGRQQTHWHFFFRFVPDAPVPHGSLENRLLAVMGKDAPTTHIPTEALQALVEGSARRAQCPPHRLVRSTVEKDVRALGLQRPLNALGKIGLATKFFFGDDTDIRDSIQDTAGAILPKRAAVVPEEALRQQLQDFAGVYNAFEADHYDLLRQLYQQLNAIIERNRPDASSN